MSEVLNKTDEIPEKNEGAKTHGAATSAKAGKCPVMHNATEVNNNELVTCACEYQEGTGAPISATAIGKTAAGSTFTSSSAGQPGRCPASTT